MPAILSLSWGTAGLWASGPEGLTVQAGDMPQAVLQPQEQLYCSAAVRDTVVVGGLPHILALSTDSGAGWHAVHMDEVQAPVMCIAPDPDYLETGVMLAGTAGEGILRTDDRGWHWTLANFGLENFAVLSLAWAAPPGPGTWPAWSVVFAATEDGIYRSPNGGLGWRRCANTAGVFQTLAVSREFQHDGTVLAGSDGGGLWRSVDGGRSFEKVSSAPEQVNALLSTRQGWLLSDAEQMYISADGERWTALAGSKPALTLLEAEDAVWLGTEDGLDSLALPEAAGG